MATVVPHCALTAHAPGNKPNLVSSFTFLKGAALLLPWARARLAARARQGGAMLSWPFDVRQRDRVTPAGDRGLPAGSSRPQESALKLAPRTVSITECPERP